MKLMVNRRRRDAAAMISEDPWTIVVYRRGETPDDSEESWEFVGRVQPAGMRAVAVERWSVELRGEHTIGRYTHGILAPHDVKELRNGDELKCTSQLDSNTSKKLRVIYSAKYSYKQEALCDELA